MSLSVLQSTHVAIVVSNAYTASLTLKSFVAHKSDAISKKLMCEPRIPTNPDALQRDERRQVASYLTCVEANMA